MNVPAMYYAGLVSNSLFLILTIFGYFYIARQTGQKYLFLIFFMIAWFFSATSYGFLVAGTSADVWYITTIRIIFYVFFLAMVISMIVELGRKK